MPKAKPRESSRSTIRLPVVWVSRALHEQVHLLVSRDPETTIASLVRSALRDRLRAEGIDPAD